MYDELRACERQMESIMSAGDSTPHPTWRLRFDQKTLMFGLRQQRKPNCHINLGGGGAIGVIAIRALL